jgi:hypothetical protein
VSISHFTTFNSFGAPLISAIAVMNQTATIASPLGTRQHYGNEARYELAKRDTEEAFAAAPSPSTMIY